MIHPVYPVAGIDISAHQGVVDFATVKQKAGFVILRAGVGQTASMKDSQYKNYVGQCKGRGIPWGVYWFWVPEKDPEVQAEVFWKFVKEKPPLGAWADVEINSFNVPKEKLVKNLIAFLKATDARFGKPTGLYTAAGFWDVWIDESKFARLALGKRKKWVAQYLKPEHIGVVNQPWLPKGFTGWDLWQFSAKGNGRGAEFGVSSPDIDLDVFPGSAAAFKTKFGVAPGLVG